MFEPANAYGQGNSPMSAGEPMTDASRAGEPTRAHYAA